MWLKHTILYIIYIGKLLILSFVSLRWNVKIYGYIGSYLNENRHMRYEIQYPLHKFKTTFNVHYSFKISSSSPAITSSRIFFILQPHTTSNHHLWRLAIITTVKQKITTVWKKLPPSPPVIIVIATSNHCTTTTNRIFRL